MISILPLQITAFEFVLYIVGMLAMCVAIGLWIDWRERNAPR